MTALSEADFQAHVVELAKITGWRVMHVRRSVGRRSGGAAWQTTTSIKGWPDLFLFHPGLGAAMAVELKSDAGHLTPEQTVVLAELAASGVDARVWRPRDWPEVESTLTRRAT